MGAGPGSGPPYRIGQGYDSHRLAAIGEGRPLVVGGVAFDSPVGPVAHSDGDALMHAITDAVLGAIGSAGSVPLPTRASSRKLTRASSTAVRIRTPIASENGRA